ncbi:hypothetical protein [Nitratireductor pacificus]|uniref:hypothetical protein n=1 Tax=Nitratireductor pacificus TaxID=1231180 RepID=UPI0012F65E0B|nr:hypothetical protein [Nitratireductor pacificus]
MDELVSTVKARMPKHFGRQIGDVYTGPLKAMAVAALRDIAGGEKHDTAEAAWVGTSPCFAPCKKHYAAGLGVLPG